MNPHVKDILRCVPSTLKPLYQIYSNISILQDHYQNGGRQGPAGKLATEHFPLHMLFMALKPSHPPLTEQDLGLVTL